MSSHRVPPSELIRDAAERAARYVESVRERPVFPPPDALTGLEQLATRASLDRPIDATEVIDLLDELGAPATVATTGGRYFGFVTGGVEPAGLAASILAGAWDQNAALPVMSPTAGLLDALAADWVIDLLGLPSTAEAAFCAGASIANLTAIVTGRDALLRRVGWDTAALGLFGAPPIDVVATEEIHSSALKALRVAGLGSGGLHEIATDALGRARPESIPAEIANSNRPTLVLLQAGNVNTGHSDPFAQIIERFEADSTWVHVDGAFGLWANTVPERRADLRGVELADSWATDGHKWLNSPYDCGVVAVADPSTLRRSMSMDAAYASAGDHRSAMNLGLQMSQAARAIPVWAILATLGRHGVADAVDRCCRHAERLARELEAAGVELLCPPGLNQVLASFGSDATTDRVIADVQAGGEAWMGATTWHGRRAMRISVSDTSTTDADIDRTVAAILAAR